MSTATEIGVRRQQDQEMIGALLHSLSQPLTTLCCSLELSMEKTAGQQHEAVATALEQAERVIGLVKLLREYLDAELTQPAAKPILLMPILRGVVEQLSSLAAVREGSLRLSGSSTVQICLPPERLRLALQYLIGGMIDAQPPHGQIAIQVRSGPAECILKAYAKLPPVHSLSRASHDSVVAILRQARLAIARRLLDPAGVSLEISEPDAACGFVLRIPHPSARPV